MSVAKADISNSSYIGVYAIATDYFSILSSRATASEEKFIQDTLETRVIRSTVDGSGIIGVYLIANSNGVLMPEIADRIEISHLKAELDGINVEVLSTDLNALRNNILANDKVAFVNSGYDRRETKIIEDVLGVEVIKRDIGGFDTVGANNILTNRGMVLSNSATEEDVELAKRFVGNVSQTTANLGSSSVGLCVIANSKGMLVGQDTTGFEMVRLSEGLDL